MRSHKIFMALATLLLFCNISPKIYMNETNKKLFDGKRFNVFDVYIHLDKFRQRKIEIKEEQKELLVWGCREDLMPEEVEEKEAMILCSNIIRKIMLQAREDDLFSGLKFTEWSAEESKDVIDKLNNKEKWAKFITKDKEFVLLIPKEKYDVDSVDDLQKMGLTPYVFDKLDEIDEKFEQTSKDTQIKRLEKLSKKNPKIKTNGLISVATLMQIFSTSDEAKKIMKRIILYGHGLFQEEIQSKTPGAPKIRKPISSIETGAAIAQLSPNQYIQLLERFKNAGCSFLYTRSCYSGGWNALTCQNAEFYLQKNIFEKFESIAKEIPFIIYVSSLPDVSASGNYNIREFFLALHQFFEKEKNEFKKYLSDITKKLCPNPNIEKIKKVAKIALAEAKEGGEEYEKISKAEANERLLWTKALCKKKIEDITEIDSITGKLLIPIFGKPLSLIERKPWLISSITEIMGHLTSISPENYGSIRFPGKPFFRTALAYQKFLQDLPQKIQDQYKELFEKIAKTGQEREKIFNIIQETKNIPENKEKIEKLQQELQEKRDKMIQAFSTFKPPKRHLSMHFYPFTISYLSLIEHQIKKGKNTPIEITYPKNNILIYPSIVDVPIKFFLPLKYESAKILSMISGRAQHYIKKLDINKKIDLKDIKQFFYKYKNKTTLYFIETLSNLKDKDEVKNFIIYMKGGEKEPKYIYKIGDQYYNGFNEKDTIDTKKAKLLIKKWLLETTPAKEAIHEATAGIENIYKIRRKINQVIPGLFKKKELMSRKPF